MNKFLPLALLIGFSLTGNTMAKTGTSVLPDVKISQLPDTQQAPEHSTVSERVTSVSAFPLPSVSARRRIFSENSGALSESAGLQP